MLASVAVALGVTIACTSEAESPDDDDKRHDKRPAVSAEVLAKGKNIYLTTCAPCHGDTGRGDGPASKIFKPPPRDHTDAAYMDTITDHDLGKTIQQGGVMKGKPAMPSNPQIRDADLAALIAYVRSLSKHTQ